MPNRTARKASARWMRRRVAVALLVCAAGFAACQTVRIANLPPPDEPCLTEADTELLCQLLGRESVGKTEEDRLQLQAVCQRVADSGAYCETAEGMLR